MSIKTAIGTLVFFLAIFPFTIYIIAHEALSSAYTGVQWTLMAFLFYGVAAIISIIATLIIKNWWTIKYKSFHSINDDEIIKLYGCTRFRNKEKLFFSVDMNGIQAIAYDYDLYAQEISYVAFWDQNPHPSSDEYGLHTTNRHARNKAEIRTDALQDNTRLNSAFREAFLPAIEQGRIISYINFHDEKLPIVNVPEEAQFREQAQVIVPPTR